MQFEQIYDIIDYFVKNPPKYYTQNQAALRMRCSKRTVQRIVKRGELRAYRPGYRTVLIEAEELDRYMHAAIRTYVPTEGY